MRLAALAVLCGGCAYHGPYPEKWAPVVNDPVLCAHIDGDYTPYDYSSRFVINWLAPSNGENDKPVAADKLSLKILDKALTATAYLDGQPIGQKRYEVQCGGESLLLDLGNKFEAGQGTVGYASYVLHLRKDSTGSIVVNEASSGIGAYGLIPFGGSSSTWVARFVPYDPKAVVPQEPRAESTVSQCSYNLSHIVVDTRDEADKVEKALEQGKSFAQLAETENSRFLMRVSKGQLGWVSPDFFPTLAPVISGLKKGEFNRVPVKDKLGWHIIRVNDVRPDGCIATGR